MNTLSYKPSWPEVLQRLRALYERRARDQIFATMTVPSATIAEFQRRYPQPQCDYPDPEQRADFWDRLLRSAPRSKTTRCPAPI